MLRLRTPTGVLVSAALALWACGTDGPGSDPGPTASAPTDGDGGATQTADGGSGATDASTPDVPPGTAAPPCSSDGWCWAWPPGVGSNVEAIDGTSDTNVWLSGQFGVLRYDGQALRFQEDIASDLRCKAVAAVSPTEAWAFCDNVGSSTPAYRWNGAAWTKQASLDAPYGAIDHARAFGDTVVAGGGRLYLKRGAGKWEEQQTGLGASVVGIAGTGPNDIWIASHRGLSHFDGVTWTASLGPTMDVWALDADANGVWLAGRVAGLDSTPTVARPTGATWEITRAPFKYGPFTSIKIVGPNDVLAVGAAEGMARWDGAQWTYDTTDHASWSKVAWKSPAGTLWAGGRDGRLQRREGGAWKRVSGRQGSASMSVHDIWGSSAADMWAVGASYLADGRTTRALLLHFDGTSLTEATPPPGDLLRYLEEVSGSGPSNVWARSDRELLRYDGVSWSKLPPPNPTTHSLDGLHVAGPNDVWIVEKELGSAPTECRANHFDGVTWTPTTGISCQNYASSLTTIDGELWMAVNQYRGNRLARWSGDQWEGGISFEDTPSGFSHQGASNAWFASGRHPYRLVGSSWQQVPLGTTSSRTDSVHTVGPNDLWITSNEHVRRWQDGTWTSQRTGLSSHEIWPSRTKVWGAASTDMWLQTDRGLLRRRL